MKKYAIYLTREEICKLLVILDNHIDEYEKDLKNPYLEDELDIKNLITIPWLRDMKNAKKSIEDTWNDIPPWEE